MVLRHGFQSSLRRVFPAAPLAAAMACAAPAPLAVEDLAAATRLSEEPRAEAAVAAPISPKGFELVG
ncbi:MAG TPA: hypothetical protein VKM54_13190, partial [Myxococcota bacterium]|nr:hypothetical protein [Myxococcota bacterium]